MSGCSRITADASRYLRALIKGRRSRLTASMWAAFARSYSVRSFMPRCIKSRRWCRQSSAPPIRSKTPPGHSRSCCRCCATSDRAKLWNSRAISSLFIVLRLFQSVQGKHVAIPDPNRDPERLKKAVHIVLMHSGRGQVFAHYRAISRPRYTTLPDLILYGS